MIWVSARRIEVLRGFAKYCIQFEPATELPAADTFGKAHRRLIPHIYSEREIVDLLDACGGLHPRGGLRGQSCRAIFGLLASTGMRIGEVTALRNTDINLDKKLIEVRNSKFGKSRWVPLHCSTVRHLREYVAKRANLTHQATNDELFFVGDYDRAMSAIAVRYAFDLIRQKLGWKSRGGHQNVRIHDYVSGCTIEGYRDTFRLFLSFMHELLKKRPAELSLNDLDADTVLAFLNHLEKQRGNSPRTRNTRLAAIRSFVHFVSFKNPAQLAKCEQILAIPVKRFEKPLVGFVEREQMDAILNAPDLDTWSGRRDHALFMTMYNTGARVSELIGMSVSDLTVSPKASVTILGKGRKLRTVPLWPATAKTLKQWLTDATPAPNSPLFPNRSGQRMSRTGVSKRLALAASLAATAFPALAQRRITPHVIRHSTAMHLLQSGVDITVIALWLGHESPATTHGYIEADITMKERAMQSIAPKTGKPMSFKADDELLGFLNSL